MDFWDVLQDTELMSAKTLASDMCFAATACSDCSACGHGLRRRRHHGIAWQHRHRHGLRAPCSARKIIFKVDAALASTQGDAYARGMAYERVVAVESYVPKSSAPIPLAGAWVYNYVANLNARAPTPIHIAQATQLLSNAAMREAAAMTEEDSDGAANESEAEDNPEPLSIQTQTPQDHVDVVEEPTRNVPETTEDTGVAEPRSGSPSIVDEATQHALVEFNAATAIASTHGSDDDVVVDEVLEEPEEPGVGEVTDEESIGYRTWGLPTRIIVAREGDYYIKRSQSALVDVISRAVAAREHAFQKMIGDARYVRQGYLALPRIATDLIYWKLYQDWIVGTGHRWLANAEASGSEQQRLKTHYKTACYYMYGGMLW